MSCVVENTGKKIIAILKTITANSVLDVMVVSLFFVLLFFLSAFIARGDKSSEMLILLINTYRLLFFGDADKLDECWDKKSPWTLVFTIGWTLFFNIMILNLVIAVFGSEYNRMCSTAEQHYTKARAVLNCKYYLMLDHFGEEAITRYFPHLPCICCPLIWISLLAVGTIWQNPVGSPCAYAIGEIVLFVWTRKNNLVDVKDGEQKFLWFSQPIAAERPDGDDDEATKRDLNDVAEFNDLKRFEDVFDVFDAQFYKVKEEVDGLKQKLNAQVKEVRRDIPGGQ